MRRIGFLLQEEGRSRVKLEQLLARYRGARVRALSLPGHTIYTVEVPSSEWKP